MSKLFILSILFIVTQIKKIELQAVDFSLPIMFADEICSYNGQNIGNSTSNVTCLCYPDFTNDNNSNRTINGVKVQCSYEKKRRFIALFLSIFTPFGFDYLYLGRYYIFAIIFLICCFTLFGNCARFAVSNHNNYFENKLNLLFAVLFIIMYLFTLVNVILVGTGLISDGNDEATVNDLYFLVNINNQ